MTLLVVDDDPVIRMTLRTILTAEGHAVSTAASAEAALSLWDEFRHDMIITDVVMPTVGGVQLRDALRAKQGGASTPVLFISGYEDAAALDVIKNPNIEGYYRKGTRLEQLSDWIQYLAGNAGKRTHAIRFTPRHKQMRPGAARA